MKPATNSRRPRQGGHEQAPIESPHGFEAPFESALKEGERIARRRQGLPVAVRRLMSEQKARHRIDQRAREHIRADQGENDRFRHRSKQVAGNPAQSEHRHEDDADAQERNGRGNDDLPRAVHDRGLDVLALLEMVVDVLDRDGRVIDENADRERKTAERHHIDRFAGGGQERDRGENRERNRDHDDEGRTPAAKKDEDHQSGQRRGDHALKNDRRHCGGHKSRLVADRFEMKTRAAGSYAVSATAP